MWALLLEFNFNNIYLYNIYIYIIYILVKSIKLNVAKGSLNAFSDLQKQFYMTCNAAVALSRSMQSGWASS